MASPPPNPTSLRPKTTTVPLHDTASHPIATPLQVKHAIEQAKAATTHVTTARNVSASASPSTADDTSKADDVPVATTMEAVQERIRTERLERQREQRKFRIEKERVARMEKWKRDMEAPIIRKDRWGKKSQEEMAKRRQRRALEREVERLDAEREARREERREKRRVEEGTLPE